MEPGAECSQEANAKDLPSMFTARVQDTCMEHKTEQASPLLGRSHLHARHHITTNILRLPPSRTCAKAALRVLGQRELGLTGCTGHTVHSWDPQAAAAAQQVLRLAEERLQRGGRCSCLMATRFPQPHGPQCMCQQRRLSHLHCEGICQQAGPVGLSLQLLLASRCIRLVLVCGHNHCLHNGQGAKE